MKRLVIVVSLFLFLLPLSAQPKYIFYIIGDGMGVNQVNGAEMFYGELAGKTGPERFLFTTFPYSAFVNTHSANWGVTDSAAAGTALATGHKTNNACIGVDADSVAVYSIAAAAQTKGQAVGLITSGEIDDATPAAFAAHSISRRLRYEIALDMLEVGFDYYAGTPFSKPQPEGKRSLYELAPEYGYTFVGSVEEYESKADCSSKIIYFPKTDFPFAIDRKPGDATLAELTACGIDFLKDRGNGFFLMVEASKIDWAGHAADPATNFREIKDLDESVKLAYDFYLEHPDETLIIVTADHETGGAVLGAGSYSLNLQAYQYQTMSGRNFTARLQDLRKTCEEITWERIQKELSDAFGFWTNLTLNEDQEKRLKDIYDKTLTMSEAELVKSLYDNDEQLAEAAKEIISEIAEMSFACGAHTGGYVPLYAIGVGAENFHGVMDNTSIPKTVAQIAGY